MVKAVTDAAGNVWRREDPVFLISSLIGVTRFGSLKLFRAVMSASVKVTADIDVVSPPRMNISESKGSLTCGFTTVSIKVFSRTDAEPLSLDSGDAIFAFVAFGI